MFQQYIFICCVIFLGFLEIVNGKGTGFKARITSNGLNYANKVAMDALAAKIRTFSVPDQHGDSGGVEYDLTNMRVTGFTEPQSNIVFLPGAGLQWTAHGSGVSMHGDFHYKIHKKWIPSIRGSGCFDISVSGLDFSINMIFGVDVNGLPTIAASGCSCGISSVNIKFPGGLSWLYNLFSGKLENIVKKTLKNKICDSVTTQINDEGDKNLASLPVTVKLDRHFLLDYRLLQTPNVQPSFMETFHKGEIFWLGDETDAPFELPTTADHGDTQNMTYLRISDYMFNTLVYAAQKMYLWISDCMFNTLGYLGEIFWLGDETNDPFEPPTMADIGDTQKMMYLWISDYMFNTLGYAAQMHNYLVRNITAADLPPDQRGILNTTCTSFICLWSLIPQLQNAFPNSTVELNLFSGNPPTMTITHEGINVSCGGKIVLYARQKDNSLAYLMSIIATMETTLNVSIASELVYGKIYDIKFLLNVTNSAVGSVSGEFIQMLINNVLKKDLIPKINEMGQKGFPLPVTGKIRFINCTLRLLQHAVVIETDLNYTG